MLRTGADVREAQCFQHATNRDLVEIDIEPSHDDPPEVYAAPTYDDVGFRIRTRFDDPCKFGALCCGQLGPRPRRLAIDKAVRPAGIEGVHPVSQRLPIHAADPRGGFTTHAVANGGQGEKAARLFRVAAAGRQSTLCFGTVVVAQFDRCRHRRPRISFPMQRRNHKPIRKGIPIPHESASVKVGIIA